MNAVLVDDELHCTESLDILLRTHCAEVQVMGKFNRPEEALKYLSREQPDVVFLDIEMPVYNGFELLNQLTDHSFDVVFTTAYDQFAVKAFKYSAFDYLLKPIDPDELKACVGRLGEKKQENGLREQLSFLQNVLVDRKQAPDRIALPTTQGLEYVSIADIIRCESDSNYTRIIRENAKPTLICRTLKEVEELLSGNDFARVHHSHLINLDHLRKHIRSDGGYVVMSDGSEIGIARSRRDVLDKQLKVKTFRN